MRPTAQVQPISLAIDADRLADRDAADDLGLVVLTDRLEVGDGRITVPDFAHDGFIAVDDLFHARLDSRQIVEAERRLAREIVVESILDRRADGHLRAGKQLLHRLGQDVADIMANGLQRLRCVTRQDLEGPAVLKFTVQVQQLSVEFDEGRTFLQRF